MSLLPSLVRPLFGAAAQPAPSSVRRSARSLRAGLVCTLLATALGCPTTEEPRAIDQCASEAPEHHEVQLSQVRLDVRCQGQSAEGEPTFLLLHGFPEFWQAWAPVMDRLAPTHRVIAPDQRGYNLSDKPEGIENYQLDILVNDVVELIEWIDGPVVLVGHDWGGGVSWAVASDHPELLERLVIMNAPHMNVFADQLANNPEQASAFSYVNLFLQPGAADLLANNDFALLADFFEGVLDEQELAEYKTAWGQEGALDGGLNWYRANFDDDGLPIIDRELTVSIQTDVLWGMDDTALLPSNLDDLPDYVDDLTIHEVPGATHWIAHEVPDQVASVILGE